MKDYKSETENASKKRIKNAPAVIGSLVAGAAAIAGGIIGYKMAETKLRKEYEESMSDYYIPKNLLPRINELHSNSDINIKLKRIREKLESKDWIDRHGAILTCFSEFELTLFKLCESNNIKIERKTKYHKKIEKLENKSIISSSEANLLKKLSYTRNNLVHGNYSLVNEKDLFASYDVICSFLAKYG